LGRERGTGRGGKEGQKIRERELVTGRGKKRRDGQGFDCDGRGCFAGARKEGVVEGTNRGGKKKTDKVG